MHGPVAASAAAAVSCRPQRNSQAFLKPAPNTSAGRGSIFLRIGILLGLFAWASGSLIPGMIAHMAMDIGMFAFWWTGYLGTFSAKTIALIGVDRSFEVAVATAAGALVPTLIAIVRLRLLRRSDDVRMNAEG